MTDISLPRNAADVMSETTDLKLTWWVKRDGDVEYVHANCKHCRRPRPLQRVVRVSLDQFHRWMTIKRHKESNEWFRSEGKYLIAFFLIVVCGAIIGGVSGFIFFGNFLAVAPLAALGAFAGMGVLAFISLLSSAHNSRVELEQQIMERGFVNTEKLPISPVGPEQIAFPGDDWPGIEHRFCLLPEGAMDSGCYTR